jgi:hypothetical protein
MSGKQLSVTVSMIDQMTAPSRGIVASLLGIGTSASKTSKAASKDVDSLASRVGNLGKVVRNLLIGFSLFTAARGITGEFNDASKSLDRINDAAQRTPLSTEMLSELSYVAKLSGQEFDSLTESVSTMAKNVSQFVNTGSGKAADAFRRLGVPLRDSRGQVRDLNKLLPELADAIANLDDGTEQIELSKRIFGDDRVLVWMKEGGQRLRLMGEEARRLGLIYTPEMTRSAALYRDSVDRVGMAWEGLWAKAVGKYGPDLARLGNQLASLIAAMPDIIGTTANNVSQAFAGDAAAKAKFTALFDSLKEVARAGVASVAVIVFTGVDILVDRIFNRFWDKFGNQMSFVPLKVNILYSRAYQNLLRGIDETFSDYLPDWWINQTKKVTQERLDALDDMEVGIERKIRESNKRITPTQFRDGFNETTAMAEAMKAAGGWMSEAGNGFWDAADGVTGFRLAIEKTDISKIIELQEGITRKKKDASRDSSWKQLSQGFDTALDQMQERSENFRGFAENITTSTFESFSSGAASVSLDLINSIDNVENALRDFFGGLFRQVAQAILQFQILRLVMGIAGAIAGGDVATKGVGEAGNYAYGPNPLPLPDPSVPAFASGGTIGSRFGRTGYGDRVLIRADPQEGIVNTLGMARNPGALDYINRGGRVQPAGSGGVVINAPLTVNVNGGGTPSPEALRAIQRAQVAGLEQAFATNPALRQRFSAMLRA